MNILFITSSRIGDAILSTGILDELISDYPDSKITVACGPLVTGFFEAVPNVETVIPLQKKKRAGHWVELWKQVISTKWDIVVDLRNSAVSRLIRAKQRYIYGPHIDHSLHKAEQNAQVLKLDAVPFPKLWFDRTTMQVAATMMGQGDGPILAVGPAANWLAKTWPAEGFIEVVQWMTAAGGIMENARVAVIAAPGEEDQARPVLQSVPQDRRIDLIAKGTPIQAAACLSLCDFYIGNDSGLMHAAAAANVPTIGVFGPSYPHLYAPYGQNTAWVQTPQTFDELINYDGYTPQTAPCLMEGLTVDRVKQCITEFAEKAQEAAA